VAAAEVEVGEERRLGFAVLGGLGKLDQKGVAADLERRRVEALGLRLAPMPDSVEHAEAGAAEAFAAADTPVVVGGGRKAGGAGLDLRAALLLEPGDTVKLGELAEENVAQRRQMPDVERGVVEEFRRDRALGPVGFLAGLVDRGAEVILEERAEADALAAEELRGEHS